MPIVEAFRESDRFGQAILILLFVLSIAAWSVILRKYLNLRRARLASAAFSRTYRKYSADPFALTQQNLFFDECPFYEIADEALGTLAASVPASSGNPEPARPSVRPEDIEVIEKNLDRRISTEATKMERGLGLLATAAAVSPFLGLLGTVWGVLIAFQQMAVQQSAQIHVVGQGVSVALATTVVGLLVAIPSLVMYNWMVGLVRRFETEMENFASEVVSDIERQYVARERA